MLLTVLVGIAAGYLTPIMEPKMKEWVENINLAPIEMKQNEFDLLTLLALLVAGGVLLALVGAEGSIFLIAVGAIIGLFGTRIWASLMRGGKNGKGPNY